MHGGSDGLYGALATVGLALSMLAWVARGTLAWGLRLGGLALVTLAALALLIGVIRPRPPK